MTSRSSLSVKSSWAADSPVASRARIDSISRVRRWFSSAARACAVRICSIIPTRRFSFSSRRSIGSRSTLRVAVFAIRTPHLVTHPVIWPLIGELSNSISRSPDNQVVESALSLNRAVLAHECGQNSVDALLHVGIGERPIRRLERQSHREADVAFADAFALIPIEERNRGQRRGRPAPRPPEWCHECFPQARCPRRRSTDRGRPRGAAAARAPSWEPRPRQSAADRDSPRRQRSCPDGARRASRRTPAPRDRRGRPSRRRRAPWPPDPRPDTVPRRSPAAVPIRARRTAARRGPPNRRNPHREQCLTSARAPPRRSRQCPRLAFRRLTR